MNDDLADDPVAARRFAREAAAGARVRSAHVVQVLDYGVSRGSPFIVMELLHGTDLRGLLETRGTSQSKRW
jgi:eukaryotic-like serine/threonine-protein kinase